MKKIKFLFILLFSISLSFTAQTKNQEKKFKKIISTFSIKVKKIKDRKEKQVALEKFVDLFNEKVNKLDKNKMSEIEVTELNGLLANINNGLNQVKGGTHEELNNYADFVESEFNQAYLVVTIIIILFFGIILPLVIF